MSKLINLTWVFALLSILAIGGGTAVLPEMERLTIHHFHWISRQEFRAIYSIGQIAPGPNMTMVLLIGYSLSGALGAVVVGLSFFLPDCVLTLIVHRFWDGLKESRWRTAVQHGMAPVAIGLMLSGTYTVARLSIFNTTSLLIAFGVFLLIMWRDFNSAVLVIGAGLAYMLLPHVVQLFPH
ncbi:MAG: chromate transporter [Deltaproteobacteria bacterium]|nr:chromate transporter [Deltaproteobacteria bacterium]